MDSLVRRGTVALFRRGMDTTLSSYGSLLHALESLKVDISATGGSSMITRARAAFHDTSSALDTDEKTTINPLQQAPSMSDLNTKLTYSPSSAGEKRARAVLRGARIGPRKLNQFVDVLRGLHIEDALIQCRVHHKKAARMCEKLLESAKANAVTNHGLDGANLKVDEAWVGKGQYLRRVSIHGRGRSGVMHKTRSHLTIVLKEEATPRKTKVIPMLQERTKWKRV